MNLNYYCQFHGMHDGVICPKCREINYENDKPFYNATSPIRELFKNEDISSFSLYSILQRCLSYPSVGRWILGIDNDKAGAIFRLHRVKMLVIDELKVWASNSSLGEGLIP
jgi:hypothetical protein